MYELIKSLNFFINNKKIMKHVRNKINKNVLDGDWSSLTSENIEKGVLISWAWHTLTVKSIKMALRNQLFISWRN